MTQEDCIWNEYRHDGAVLIVAAKGMIDRKAASALRLQINELLRDAPWLRAVLLDLRLAWHAPWATPEIVAADAGDAPQWVPMVYLEPTTAGKAWALRHCELMELRGLFRVVATDAGEAIAAARRASLVPWALSSRAPCRSR